MEYCCVNWVELVVLFDCLCVAEKVVIEVGALKLRKRLSDWNNT